MSTCRIGIDLDGTLAGYQRELMNFSNRYYSDSFNFNDIKRDDCYDLLGNNMISRAVKLRKFYSYSNSLKSVKPVNGAVEAIKSLKQRGFSMVIVTSRFAGFSKNTKLWLDKSFGKGVFDQVLFSSILSSYSAKFKPFKYSKMNVDIVIEDSPYIAVKCASIGIPVILLDYPWNRGFEFPGVIRVKDWKEATDIIYGVKVAPRIRNYKYLY